MSYLTARAEQALIGALLTDQPLPGEFAHLRADDFGHRVLRDLYGIIVNLREHVPAADLPDAVAERVTNPDIDATWLRDLRNACPAPAHIAAYARMVQVAAFRRDIVRESERIAATAATDGATDHFHRLTDALTRQTQVYAAFTEIDETQAMHIHSATETTHIAGIADNRRAAREDQLLADLLAHPEQAAEVARVVPPETFTTEQRREIFMTIATLAAQGDLVDEVVVLWEFQRLRAVADLYGGDDLTYRGDETSPEPTAAYLARLADTATINSVTTDTAITIGYELVVDDVRNQLARSAAAAAQRATVSTRTNETDPRRQFDPALQPPAQAPNGHQPKIDR